MSEVTVKQLADMVGIPVVRLLAQLGDAGVQVSGADATITEQEKTRLLSHLRRSHGKLERAAGQGPSRITLKRKSISELRQPITTARSTGVRSAAAARTTGAAKTISVELRRKRTYVKRAEVSKDAVKLQDAEAARQALAEQAEQQRKQEEESRTLRSAQEARLQAKDDAKREAEAEAQRQTEVEEARREAEEEALRQAEEARLKAEEEAAQKLEEQSRVKEVKEAKPL